MANVTSYGAGGYLPFVADNLANLQPSGGPPTAATYGPVEATKGNRRPSEGTLGGDISQLYDVANDPRFPVSGGFLPGTWATKGETALQAIDAEIPHSPGTTTDAKFGYRATPEMQQPYPVNPFPTKPATPTKNISDLFGSAFTGGWGSNGLLDFSGPANGFTGVPGEGDPWAGSRGNSRSAGQPGLVTGSGVYGPSSVPTPATHGIADLFGFLTGGASPAAPAQPGYNGQTSVTSNELAGANQGFGGQNAVMPDSMNNSRWLTGY